MLSAECLGRPVGSGIGARSGGVNGHINNAFFSRLGICLKTIQKFILRNLGGFGQIFCIAEHGAELLRGKVLAFHIALSVQRDLETDQINAVFAQNLV